MKKSDDKVPLVQTVHGVSNIVIVNCAADVQVVLGGSPRKGRRDPLGEARTAAPLKAG